MQDKSATFEDRVGVGPLPKGRYNFKVNESVAGASQAGNPVMKVVLEVLDGPLAGRTTKYSYTINSGVNRIMGLMKAVWGQTREDFDAGEFVGARFSAEVSHRDRADGSGVFVELSEHQPYQPVQAQSAPQGWQPQR
jgi:hypothetical protein